MTIDEAKLMADRPHLFSLEQLEEALAYLEQPRIVSRMNNVNDERALQRYVDRLERLENGIEAIRNADEARRVS